MGKNLKVLEQALTLKCKETNTSLSGIKHLEKYYIDSLGWSKEKAITYILELFDNGTIDSIKILGVDGKEL